MQMLANFDEAKGRFRIEVGFDPYLLAARDRI